MPRYQRPGQGRPAPKQFENLEATALFCPTCNQAMPVRARLLLVLPQGEKYEYLCARCGTSVGEKLDQSDSSSFSVIV